MLNQDQVKAQFEKDTKNHTMEILRDDGLYRHLKFSNGGSQCYRFDIHTWPGFLCICQDMGTYVFSRVPDMFEFFVMGDNDFNKKHVINPHYWGEKLRSVDSNQSQGHDSNGWVEFSPELFAANVKQEYDRFCEDFVDDDDEEVTEAYPEDTQSRKQQLEELWDDINSSVLSHSDDGPVRAYDAAMDFRWESEDGNLNFDMQDFWEHDCNDYTHHYIWILHAIVWGITEYNKEKETQTAIDQAEVDKTKHV